MLPILSLFQTRCRSLTGSFCIRKAADTIHTIGKIGSAVRLLFIPLLIVFAGVSTLSAAPRSYSLMAPDPGAAEPREPGSIDPFKAIYPPAAKIIGQGEAKKTGDTHVQSIFYGSGSYVAEVGEFGIVLTNWHVVSEAVGPLLVKFSHFESPGTVIMADTVWDIAAIVIYKPPFLPFPISLEVPQLGDELWVAGFGQQPDLSAYQVSSGPVLGYGRPNDPDDDQTSQSGKWNCGPDTKATLPCETIQIGTGVRYGDSGGPIINQYGELAGILWGSDGHLAMGTFCLRLQAFLTQAQFQLMHYRMSSSEFFAKAARREVPMKKIAMPSIPAQNALRSSGIFPISSVPVYSSGSKLPVSKELPAYYKPAVVTNIDGAKSGTPSKEFLRVQADYKNTHKEGFSLPPYPAVKSPTLTAQRKAIGRNHPEVYVDSRFAAAKPKNRGTSEIQATGASNVALAPTETPKKNTKKASDGFRNASLEKAPSNPKIAAQTVADETVGADEENSETEKEKGSWRKKVPGFPQISLNNVQSIIAIVVVLFLFINSLRLLSIASERKE